MLKAGTAARRRTRSWPEPQAPDAVREEIAMLLNGIGQRLAQVQPQWIGHVKVMATHGTEATYASLTASNDQPHWAGELGTAMAHAEITVYAAIYNLTDAQVARAVDNTLSDLRW